MNVKVKPSAVRVLYAETLLDLIGVNAQKVLKETLKRNADHGRKNKIVERLSVVIQNSVLRRIAFMCVFVVQDLSVILWMALVEVN